MLSTNLKTNEIRRKKKQKQKNELEGSISEVEGGQKKVVSTQLA